MKKLLLSWLCLAGLAVPVSQAHAGALRCRSYFTGDHDRALLHAAMQEVARPGVPAEGILYICRNPGGASALMSTWARPGADGVTEWWDIWCGRGRTRWECESPVHHQLIRVYGEVGGIVRRLEVHFGDDTELDRARRLSLRAMQIILDPASAPVPNCGPASNQDTRSEWDRVRQEYVRTPQDTAVELYVQTDAQGAVVSPDEQWLLGLRLTDGSGGTSSTAVCWAYSVVFD